MFSNVTVSLVTALKVFIVLTECLSTLVNDRSLILMIFLKCNIFVETSLWQSQIVCSHVLWLSARRFVAKIS